MNWFKTLWLTSEERQALKQAKEKTISNSDAEYLMKELVATKAKLSEYITNSPYKKLIYSNGNLTVIFYDGSAISRSNVDTVFVENVKACRSESEINILMTDDYLKATSNKSDNHEVETPEEKELVKDNLEILRGHPDFTINGDKVTFKDVSLPIPSSVLASFIEICEKIDAAGSDELDRLDEQYQALSMFWLNLALNSLPQSREDLLVFIRKNDVRITRNGNLVLYRRIVTKSGSDKKLVSFITQEYYRLKKEGADTRMYAIAKSGDNYTLVNLNEYDGSSEPVPFVNLQVAYLELPTYDTNQFTAWHDKSVDIRLGGIYKIDDDGINLDNGICAAGGLHAAAVNYNYSGYGDLPVVVLVNPSKAITVPKGETGKLRTTEMFIACVNDKAQGIHFDEDALSVFDEEYHSLSLDELEKALKNKSFETLSVKDNVPAVSLIDLNAIKQLLKTRVKEVI